MIIKRLFKTIIYWILIFVLVLFIPCYAIDSTKWPLFDKDLNGQASYVLEINSGVVLFEHNSNKKMFPASLTKIMTAIVVLDNVENLDEKVKFSYNAVTKDIDKNSTTIGASAGDLLSVMECLYCILLPSANDVANALAEHVAGNITDFTLMMNEKAKWLGMENTHFSNPTGLQDDNNYSTAKDIALMLQYAMSIREFRQISQSTSFKHSPIRKYKNPDNSNNTVLNTNSLIIRGNKNYYQYAISGKTGYTKEAGYTLAACATKDNITLLVVDLGCKKQDERFVDFKNICNFYFNQYKAFVIKDIEKKFQSGYTDLTAGGVVLVKSLQFTVPDDACVLLPKTVDENLVKSSISFNVSLADNDNSIGRVVYYLDDMVVGSCDILGLAPKTDENIHTSFLNISQQNDNQINAIDKSVKYINTDTPIYLSEDGIVMISKPMSVFFTILILIFIVFLFILFIHSKLFLLIEEHFSHKIKSFRRKYKI